MARILDYKFRDDDFFTASDGTRNVKNIGDDGDTYNGVLYTGQGLKFVQDGDHNRIEFPKPTEEDLSEDYAAIFVDCTCDIDDYYPNPAGHAGYGNEPENNRINIGTNLSDNKGYGIYASDGENQYSFEDIIPYDDVKNRNYKILGQIDAVNGVVRVWKWENGTTTLVLDDDTTWASGAKINRSVPYHPQIGNLKDASYTGVTWSGIIRGGGYFNCIFTQNEVETIFNNTEKFYDYVKTGNDHGIFSFDRNDVLAAVSLTEGEGDTAYSVSPSGLGDGTLVGFKSDCWTSAAQDPIGDQNCRYKLDSNRAFVKMTDDHTVRWD